MIDVNEIETIRNVQVPQGLGNCKQLVTWLVAVAENTEGANQNPSAHLQTLISLVVGSQLEIINTLAGMEENLGKLSEDLKRLQAQS
ncbi:MAG: hypothetical protein WBB07_00670 [Mycobacterium sp.]